jgi:RND superfamily putative drug exporter
MQTLSRIVTGRRSKWLVLLAWIILAAGFGSFQSKLNSVTQNDSTTFLPAGADSTKALEELRSRFDNGRTIPALVVYQNPDGLNDADRAVIAADEEAFAALPDHAPIQSPLGPAAAQQGLLSEDGTTARSPRPTRRPGSMSTSPARRASPSTRSRCSATSTASC